MQTLYILKKQLCFARECNGCLTLKETEGKGSTYLVLHAARGVKCVCLFHMWKLLNKQNNINYMPTFRCFISLPGSGAVLLNQSGSDIYSPKM